MVCRLKEGDALGDSGNSAKENIRDVRQVNTQNEEYRI